MHTTEEIQNSQIHTKTIPEVKRELSFKHITTSDGLPENSVFSIIQDRHGFLWFATQIGIVKYDGYKMTVYRSSNADSGLSGYIPRAFLEDENNILWMGTMTGGLNKFDMEKEIFSNYRNIHGDLNSLSNDYVVFITKDVYGFLWIATLGGGLNKFDTINEIFTQYRHNPEDTDSPSSDFIMSILIDNNGILWLGTDKGLDKFDSEKNTFTHYKNHPENSNSLGYDRINTVFEDKDKFIWIGTETGLDKFNKEKEIFTHYKFDFEQKPSMPVDISSIIEDQSGLLWICTVGQGLIRFDKEKAIFTRCTHEPGNNSSLSSKNAVLSYQDFSGILWIGTFTDGINKYERQTEQFRLYRNKNSNPDLNNGRCVLVDNNGTIWIGTEYGLQKFDIHTNTYTEYKNEPGNNFSLSNNFVNSLYEDITGALWAGTRAGLNKFNRDKESFERFINEPGKQDSLSNNFIVSIAEDASGILWIGTNDGLNKFNRETGCFKVYKNIPGDSSSLSQNQVMKLYTDKQGTFWIGTNLGGLNKFDPISESFKHYNYPGEGFMSVNAIFEDSKGSFWVGTYFAGLCLFDRNTNIVTSFNTENGLSCNIVSNILEDDSGNLWLSTDLGLSRFDPESNTFTNFNMNDGLNLTPSTGTGNTASILKNGYLLFGGNEGIVGFNPDKIKKNKYIPKVVLTDLKVFDKSIRTYINSPIKKHISIADEVNLTYRENNFSFEFAALDFRVPEKNEYAYKMEGFDKGWLYTDASKRFATYTNLDPGEYTFRVKGSNNDGVWNEKGTSIKVIINPPYWKTWWFRVLAGAAVTGVFGSSIRYITIQRYKRKLALEKERTRISKDMHDEVGSSLTKIAILSEQTKQNIADQALAKTNVGKISESASEVVDNISEIIWAINPKNDALDNLLAYIREYASETLELKEIDYKIELPENIPPHHLSAEVRRNIFLVVKESINNILKYAEADKAGIVVKLKNAILEISITDNGKGFDLNKTRKFGNGLINMKKRIEDIGGKFKIESTVGNGTKSFITVNINN